MSKDYFVLRAGKVVYKEGHYDLEGARAVAKRVLSQHPKATLKIVMLYETSVSPK